MLGFVLLPVALLWLLPALAEGVALWRSATRRSIRPPVAPPRQRFLFLVPAHDESLLIERCVQSLVAMRTTRITATVVVIADNCEDDTAALARAAGATVLERRDP